MTKHLGDFVPEISNFQRCLQRAILPHLELANARRHGLPEDLDEELAWWGNAPFEWAFDGPSGTLSPLQCLNGEGRLLDHYRRWKEGCITCGDEDFHPLSWFPNWRRGFLLGWQGETGIEMVPGAYAAIDKLHGLGVKILPIVTEITETVYLVGPGEEKPENPSPDWGTAVLDHLVRSREKRLKDIIILSRGSTNQKWQVIDRWRPILSSLTPTVRITFFELNSGEKRFDITSSDPVSKRFRSLALPEGARITERIVTSSYPERNILNKMGCDIPRDAVLNWIAKQLNQMGPSKKHRRPLREVQNCALKLVQLIREQLGIAHYREIGELLRAAFPAHFNPRGDIGDATLHLVKRAQARQN
jgi:hypothetical protein